MTDDRRHFLVSLEPSDDLPCLKFEGTSWVELSSDALKDLSNGLQQRLSSSDDVYAWHSPFAVLGPRGAARGSFLATDAGPEG